MVSPEPYPVTPSSVSTRTRVASKARRGTGSQAARSGGSSGSRIRSSQMAVIFTTAPAHRMPSRLPLCAGSRLNGPKLITLRKVKVRAHEGIGPVRGGHVATYILKRLGLALITLLLLSVIVFFACQVLPGDPGRAILGPLAAESSVRALDHQLGVDRPLLVQYWTWITGILHGNFGTSTQFRAPVEPYIRAALINSLKLAALAFVIVVPLGIVGGVVAALNYGRPADRIISVAGLSATTVPEFVSGIVVIVIFGVALKVLPVSASAGPGASPASQFQHLILPAIPLVLVLFGYIARMARAGTIEALNSDYARTATLKGLKRSVVIRRHVLRNSLLPTITVIATQLGYLIGGLVIVETLFNYPGIGNLIFKAATAKDFPMMAAGVLTIGVVFMVATLAADILATTLNPRLRLGGAE